MPADLDLDDVEDSREQVTEPAKEPKPAPRRHTPRLLQRAAEVGIDESEANEYTPADLLAVINDEQARRAPKPEPVPEKEPEIDWGTDEDGRKLTEADHSPTMRRLIKNDHERALAERKRDREFAAFAKAQEERAKKLEQQEQQAAQVRLWEQGDKLFKSKAKLFGEDSYDEIDRDSPEYKRRAHIWDMMGKLKGSLKQRFEEACEVVYGEPAAKSRRVVEEDIEDEDEDRPAPPRRATNGHAKTNGNGRVSSSANGRAQEGAITIEHDEEDERWSKTRGMAVPSHRKAPEIDDDTLPGRTKKAEKEVRKLTRERGIHARRISGDEENLLPD